jgi:alpha-galactosidase
MWRELFHPGFSLCPQKRLLQPFFLLIIPVFFSIFYGKVLALSNPGEAGGKEGNKIVQAALTGDGLLLENENITLWVSNRLVLKPSLKKDNQPVSFVSGCRAEKATFYLKLGGLEIANFLVDWKKLEQDDLADSLGRGRRFRIKAYADQYGGFLYKSIKIEAELTLSFYENFPAVVFSAAKFTNLGDQRLEIDELISGSYCLDRRLVSPEERPWRFASYQGAAYRWGLDYDLIWLTPDFNRRNFMGMTELASSEMAGGGVPLVDIWAPDCGLALASAEPEPRWISLPVKTGADGLVEISITESPDLRLGQHKYLAPGASVNTLRTALILHRLDFYDALGTYAGILRAQGVNIPRTSPPLAYEPYWKSWGFRFDFTLQQIYNVLPQLKRIGIRWANLDDGWFTFYGDWKTNPAPGKFPGGEADMKAFVKRLHQEGFKTSIWWYPQGVSPVSELAREHPEWLVENEDGSLPLSKRGLYYLCPVQQECLGFIGQMTRKILAEWDFDGLYIDSQDLSSTPPCFNKAHNHSSPLDSYRGQSKFYEVVYRTAQEIKPGCPVEMCICGLPHDPFKMPFFNVANTSDPVDLFQVRRRVKVEKAFRGPSFCVGDCYQVPANEWEGFSVPESFESAMGTGAQVTTFYNNLTPAQEKKWQRWISMYRQLGLSSGEYLNLYDIAFDLPEAHVVLKNGKYYYGFFAPYWNKAKAITLRGLEKGRRYSVRNYADDIDLGVVSGDNPVLNMAFKEQLLLEVSPLR